MDAQLILKRSRDDTEPKNMSTVDLVHAALNDKLSWYPERTHTVTHSSKDGWFLKVDSHGKNLWLGIINGVN